MKSYSAIPNGSNRSDNSDRVLVIDERGQPGITFAAHGKIISVSGSGRAVSVICEDYPNHRVVQTYSLPDGFPIGSPIQV